SFWVDSIHDGFVSLCGGCAHGGPRRKLIRISYLQYVNGCAEPLALADWAFIPYAEWNGLVVRFIDDSIGELEIERRGRVRYHRFPPSAIKVSTRPFCSR